MKEEKKIVPQQLRTTFLGQIIGKIPEYKPEGFWKIKGKGMFSGLFKGKDS